MLLGFLVLVTVTVTFSSPPSLPVVYFLHVQNSFQIFSVVSIPDRVQSSFLIVLLSLSVPLFVVVAAHFVRVWVTSCFPLPHSHLSVSFLLTLKRYLLMLIYPVLILDITTWSAFFSSFHLIWYRFEGGRMACSLFTLVYHSSSHSLIVIFLDALSRYENEMKESGSVAPFMMGVLDY